MLRNDVDHLATLRAEYRDQNKAGVVADHRSDPLLATCGSRQPVAADVVVEAGPNALLFFRRGYADPAPQARPAPRFAATRGVSCGMVRDAQFARSRSRDASPALEHEHKVCRRAASRLLRSGKRRRRHLSPLAGSGWFSKRTACLLTMGFRPSS
jgi:hypothetical protein